jgi:hypothetical protein
MTDESSGFVSYQILYWFTNYYLVYQLLFWLTCYYLCSIPGGLYNLYILISSYSHLAFAVTTLIVSVVVLKAIFTLFIRPSSR